MFVCFIMSNISALRYLFFLLCWMSASYSKSTKKPNFILFIADDLGIGDVGCFGNDTIQTPNVDRIAMQGAKLTHHLAGASVCTPSRTSFLTGRYAVRSGMEASRLNKVLLFLASSGGLPANETTFAKILQQEGYSTALIGKWHLGNDCHRKGDMCHHPLKHGFDYYYGIPLTNLQDFGTNGQSVLTSYEPHFYTYLSTVLVIGVSLSFLLLSCGYRKCFWILLLFSICNTLLVYIFVKNFRILNSVILRNAETVEQPVRLNGLTQRLVLEATDFMKKNMEHPLLLVMSFVHVHTALFSAPEFVGRSKHGQYGDNVEEMDWAVGEIITTMENLGMKDNTFVYFTSDNGGHLEEKGINGERHGGYNGIYKGGKAMGGMEGGIRVPTIAMWPNHIPAKSVISVPTSQMDIFTTILHIVGVSVPNDRIIDGKNILPLLRGKEKRSPHQYLFHYCGNSIHAVRYIPTNENSVWKVYFATPRWKKGTTECPFICHCFGTHVIYHNPPLLYNIEADPSENNPIDVNSNPKWLKLIATINKAVKKHNKTVHPVPEQFSLSNTMWKPWLQPCCNFPWCYCTDEKYST